MCELNFICIIIYSAPFILCGPFGFLGFFFFFVVGILLGSMTCNLVFDLNLLVRLWDSQFWFLFWWALISLSLSPLNSQGINLDLF